jgi:hypothetical protein
MAYLEKDPSPKITFCSSYFPSSIWVDIEYKLHNSLFIIIAIIGFAIIIINNCNWSECISMHILVYISILVAQLGHTRSLLNDIYNLTLS